MIVTIITVVAIVVLIAIAFASGMMTADYFNRKAAYEVKVALQRQYARLTAGVDADDTAQPYVYVEPFRRKYHVSPQFIDRLKTNGSATESVNKQPASQAPLGANAGNPIPRQGFPIQ